MNDEIVAIYCLCDDILQAMNHRGDAHPQMSAPHENAKAAIFSKYG
jgi:hypothetical protein